VDLSSVHRRQNNVYKTIFKKAQTPARTITEPTINATNTYRKQTLRSEQWEIQSAYYTSETKKSIKKSYRHFQYTTAALTNPFIRRQSHKCKNKT
jgi:hypothetical protein